MRIAQSEYIGCDPPRDGLPEIALFGRSNVGKSTLINVVAGRRGLAHVGKTPGKTRFHHFYRINGRLYLVDLPGYGYSAAPASEHASWERLVRGYVENRSTLVAGILVVDARHFDSPLDRQLVSWWRSQRKELLVVATKTDKLGQRERRRLAGEILSLYEPSPEDFFAVSPSDGAVVEKLRAQLLRRAAELRVA